MRLRIPLAKSIVILAASALLPSLAGNNPTADAALSYGKNGRIIYASDESGNWDLWTVNRTGTDRVNITNSPDRDERNPVVFRSGKVAFEVTTPGQQGIYVGSRADLASATRRTGGNDPAWAPDGTRYAFTGRETDGLEQIFIYELATRLTTQFTFRTADGRGRFRPAWTPDGLHIAYEKSDGGIFIKDAVDPTLPEHLIWRDGGSHLAFASGTNHPYRLALIRRILLFPTGVQTDICVVELSATEYVRRISRITKNDDIETNLSWSPQGDKLAVSMIDVPDDGTGEDLRAFDAIPNGPEALGQELAVGPGNQTSPDWIATTGDFTPSKTFVNQNDGCGRVCTVTICGGTLAAPPTRK